MYGAETWTMKQKGKSEIHVTDRTFLIFCV